MSKRERQFGDGFLVGFAVAVVLSLSVVGIVHLYRLFVGW
jgi:hypothetical protein